MQAAWITVFISGFIAHLFCGLIGLSCHPGDGAFRRPAVASNLDGLPRRLAPGKRWIMRRIPVPFQRGLLCGRADALAIGKTCLSSHYRQSKTTAATVIIKLSRLPVPSQ